MLEVNRFPDWKTTTSVTGDEILGIIPPEVDELIEEYNYTCSNKKQNIDIESCFHDRSVFTFDMSPDRIVLKDRKEKEIKEDKNEGYK